MFPIGLMTTLNLNKELKNVVSFMRIELYTIQGWLCSNKISTNLTKTNSMVFSKSTKFIIPRIHINSHLVELIDYF